MAKVVGPGIYQKETEYRSPHLDGRADQLPVGSPSGKYFARVAKAGVSMNSASPLDPQVVRALRSAMSRR
ncbi:MAG: hypothetical protein WAT65_03580, partial [Candidatus Nanopelagicales bacterium]